MLEYAKEITKVIFLIFRTRKHKILFVNVEKCDYLKNLK